MRTVGVWLTAVMAAGMAGAGPITTQPATGVLDADFAVRGSAICEASTGQWTLRWGVRSSSATAAVVSARDPGNDLNLAVSGWEITTDRPVNASGSVPGGATTVALEMVIRVRGEDATRTIRRQLSLGGACAAATLPACVDRLAARYTHSFDGPAGRAEVQIDGAPPCTDSSAVLLRYYWPLGSLQLDDLAIGYLGQTRARTVVYMDRFPCDNRLQLEVAGGIAGSSGNRSTGPVGSDTQVRGFCLSPSIVETHGCTGMTLLLNNFGDAKLSAYFALSRTRSGGIETWRFSLAPGQSQSLFVLAVGNPPTAAVQPYVNGIPIGERAWVKPETCTGHDMPPVRQPSPGATPTPTATQRPLPPIRR